MSGKDRLPIFLQRTKTLMGEIMKEAAFSLAEANLQLVTLIRRVNAIEHELDELEREEFYRLKKIQDKKREARQKSEAKKAEMLKQGIDVRQVTNILDEGDDDVLF
ncbi:V-type proton ATPase subunit D 1 [Eumeta japonica]|uniref:V-type proton ATPase subunit D 1 n=1 Tax=Eumeta variegata TaxID=151549 RepID=A0A4C1T715_EUMVA|nr:V-type proton ATPase subunit D 1 [Eumeta japonica]